MAATTGAGQLAFSGTTRGKIFFKELTFYLIQIKTSLNRLLSNYSKGNSACQSSEQELSEAELAEEFLPNLVVE
jgi:hypothetical protein